MIAGCGFLGEAVARLFSSRGWEVIAWVHSADRQRFLQSQGWGASVVDLFCRDSVLSAGGEGNPPDAVIQAASTRGGSEEDYRRVYLDGAKYLAEAFPGARRIFCSSTSVYAQCDGSWVTEESPAEPAHATGKILRQAEDVVWATGGVVFRLAGLYGPGRSVYVRWFLSGEAVLENGGDRWVNQVHRDDAAQALWLAATGDVNFPKLANVSDGVPMRVRDVYASLAARTGRPLPPEGSVERTRKRGISNKRVSSERLKSLGWKPRYASFEEAVGELLAAERI